MFFFSDYGPSPYIYMFPARLHYKTLGPSVCMIWEHGSRKNISLDIVAETFLKKLSWVWSLTVIVLTSLKQGCCDLYMRGNLLHRPKSLQAERKMHASWSSIQCMDLEDGSSCRSKWYLVRLTCFGSLFWMAISVPKGFADRCLSHRFKVLKNDTLLSLWYGFVDT